MEHGSDEAGRAQLPGGGCFDPIEEMEAVYDRYAGHSSLSVSEAGWKLE